MSLVVQTTDWARELYRPHRYKVLYGGRYGFKSWQVARALVLLGATRPLDVVCAREYQNSIADSAKKTLEIQIQQCGLKRYYDVKRDYIRGANGTHFIFKGLEANRDNIRGWESKDIVWVTEAARLTHETAKVLIPTIRKPGSELWFDFNPKHRYDWVYKKFVRGDLDPGWYVRKVNYLDGPAEWMTPEILAEIEDWKRNDPDGFPHEFLGEPDDIGSDKKVLAYRDLERAVEHYRPKYEKGSPPIAGLDVADSPTGDWNALVIRRGPCIVHVERWRAPDLGVTARRALATCREYGATLLYYDAGGLGAGVKAVLAGEDVGEIVVRPVLFNGRVRGPDRAYQHKVQNREFFRSWGSQLYWSPKLRSERLARRIGGENVPAQDCLFIKPTACKGIELETYLAELSQPAWDRDTGKMRIIKDPDEVASPDMADATVIAHAPDCMSGLHAGYGLRAA